jgi:serine/threonine-protein kinase HipA
MPAIRELVVFAHAEGNWMPCGRLDMTEEGPQVIASAFAYGLRYLERPHALEVDPVSLSLTSRDAVRQARLYPVNELTLFGGIRDASPDAWGRRVIEARLKAIANSLPESTYLLEAGSDRVGAQRR